MRSLARILALVLCLASGASLAQTDVRTNPLGVTTTNASSSITLTGTFQQVFASNGSRKSCTIQNTGTHVMYVFFGAIGSATSATSFPLQPATAAANPGGAISCTAGGVVLTDQVSISGTTADTFTAVSQ